jgi:uncharacterized protein YbjT (DUF2867 family)
VLKRLGVEILFAEMCEYAGVAAACTGEESVICADPAIMPSRNGPPLDSSGVRCLVELANALGVGRFVFVTVPEQFATPCALVNARDEGCDRLEAHNMDYVILETGFFLQTWLSPELEFDCKLGKATVFGEGTQPLAWVSCDDVAELAVRALDVDHRKNRRIRVAAPENVSPFDLIRLFEEMRGEKFQVTRVPEAELRAAHQSAKDPGERVLAAMKVEYARGLPLQTTRNETPIALSSARDYAARQYCS